MNVKMNDLYNRNADFRGYVDRYRRDKHLTVEEALEHKLVHNVAEQYREAEEVIEKA